jgi:small multidrug resistance pump
MTVWVLLVLAIVMEVGSTLALRASDGLTNWVWTIPVAIGYVGSLILLAQVLRLGMPVGVAYAVWAACGVVLTAVLSHIFFGESLTWVMAGGIALIGAGVALVELGG